MTSPYVLLQTTWSKGFFGAKREKLILLPYEFQLNVKSVDF